jgi:hypothetical protein
VRTLSGKTIHHYCPPLVPQPFSISDTCLKDQISQLYMGSLDSNDSYRPFPIMNQKGVVAGELSQGQVGDIRLQQDTYVVSSAPVQSRVDSTNLSLSVFICCKTLYISPNMFGSC